MHPVIKSRIADVTSRASKNADPVNAVAYEYALSQLRQTARELGEFELNEPESLVRRPILSVVSLFVSMLVLSFFEG